MAGLAARVFDVLLLNGLTHCIITLLHEGVTFPGSAVQLFLRDFRGAAIDLGAP